MNVDETKLMYFKQGAISTLRSKPLKLVDLFRYLGHKISSTESDINICIGEDMDCYWQVVDYIKI